MPLVTALLTGVFLIYALRVERRRNPDVSAALWIPFCWMFLIGSRYVSQWLNVGIVLDSPDDYLDGSPVDRAVFFLLFAAALCVLVRRRVSLSAFMAQNVWLSVFLLYCLLSVTWSDYSFTALKRWTKVIEHVAMVLVVLSERNRSQAIDALFRRFAYLGLTLSVLFIKYFPDLGRSFSTWTGEGFNGGVTTDKNALGHLCVLSGVYFISTFVSPRTGGGSAGRAGSRLLDGLMLCFCAWLLSIANAATALVCFGLGAGLVVALATPHLTEHPKRLTYYLLAGVLVIGEGQLLFDLSGAAIQGLNRDPTLTDRTKVWADVFAMDNNPLVGTGFESFWLGPRAKMLWDKYWWKPNQAHNGYIETYINLGLVGLLLLVGTVAAGYAKAQKSLLTDPGYGAVRLGLLLPILTFNITDATFKALHVLYFVFFLVVTDLPMRSAREGGASPPAQPGLEPAQRPTAVSSRG